MRQISFEKKPEDKEKTKKIEKAKADYKKRMEQAQKRPTENRIKDSN